MKLLRDQTERLRRDVDRLLSDLAIANAHVRRLRRAHPLS